jgi:asparagine synthase (glutamine-hydrolysing)
LLGARAIQLGLTAANAPDDVAFLGHMFYILNQAFVWPGITEAEEGLLYTDAFYPQVRDLAFESLRHELSAFAKFPPAKRLDYFATIYQGIRLSHLNDVYQHAFFEARYPFCDYTLVGFVHSMPIEFRLEDRLYLAVINREIPQVTWVPRDSDNTLLTDQKLIRILHSLLQKTKHRINRHVLPIFPEWRAFHSAPEEWLRNDLRDWAANILLNPRTLERGILNPAFVRSIFDRHMAGHEIWTIGKIAPLITFEMMMRRYFDVAPATETEDSFNGN